MKNSIIDEKGFLDILSMNPIVQYVGFMPFASLAHEIDSVTGLSKKRTTQNYEIALFFEDGGYCYIDDVEYEIHKGDLRCLKPGQTIYSKKIGDFFSMHYSLSSDGKKAVMENEYTKALPTFMPSNNFKAFSAVFKELISAKAGDTVEAALNLKMKTVDLMCRVFHVAHNTNISSGISEKNREVIKNAIQFFDNNYSKDIGLEDISESVNLHPVYFNRIFSKVVGMPPIAYLRRMRLNKAKEYLLSTNLKVVSIAKKCGFSSSSYFIVQFRKEFGATPAEFRALNNEDYFEYM